MLGRCRVVRVCLFVCFCIFHRGCGLAGKGVAKLCASCGKSTVKPDRAKCKGCSSSRFEAVPKRPPAAALLYCLFVRLFVPNGAFYRPIAFSLPLFWGVVPSSALFAPVSRGGSYP